MKNNLTAISLQSLLLAVIMAACSSGLPKEQPTVPSPGTASPSTPMAQADTQGYRACTQDDECVYVTNGCCDCANGGEDLAIRKDRMDAFRATFTCNQGCTEVGAIPACGSGSVHCVQGACTYTAGASTAP